MKPFLIAILAAMCLTTCACSGSSPAAAQPTHTATVTAHPRASTPAPAPTPSSASGSPAAASCLTRDLTAAAGSPQGSAAGLEIVISFKNLGKAACTLAGYPGVAQAAGTPATDIGQPATEHPTPRTLVTLPPDGVASAMLRIADSAHYPDGTCKPVKATSLKVIPPNQKAALNVSFGSTACKGNVKLLSVTTVQQGSAG
jgi:hypothetical protein